MEVFTFSAMNKYDDDFFGYRIFNKNYALKMGEALCGWLKKENDEYKITSCGEPQPIEISRLQRQYIGIYNVEDSAFKKHSTFAERLGERYPIIDGKKLVCTSYMNRKKHEYLFPERTNIVYNLSKEVKEAFLSVYKPSPCYKDSKKNGIIEKGLVSRLNAGEEIPVFFHIDEEDINKVRSLGLSRMYRFPYKHRVSDGIRQEKINIKGEKVDEGTDMTQAIFGYINQKEKLSLRGRVQFGNAIDENAIDDNSLIEVKGVLGSPLASYYPFYIQQKGKKYVTYDDDMTIAGRKRYRIHHDKYITDLPKGNGNDKVLTTLKLIPANRSFTFSINVHNLRPVEVGALLSSLTFHQTDNIYHNIGMAKSFGYGKLKVSIKSLEGFHYDVETYLKKFEQEMNEFTYSYSKSKWTDSSPVNDLLSMASEHVSDLEFMSLDDYKNGKDNNNFSKLAESPQHISCKVTAEFTKRESLKDKFDEAERCIAEKDYEKALQLYSQLENDIKPFKTDDIVSKISEIQSIINNKKEEEEKKKLEEKGKEEEEKIKNMIDGGFGNFLEKKNLNDQYIIHNYKLCQIKALKWLKDCKRDKLNKQEIEDLSITLSRIYNGLTKDKEKIDWKADGKAWRSMSTLMNEEELKELYNKVMK
jgi:CRISPR-associated protein (TIGR03986 family)